MYLKSIGLTRGGRLMGIAFLSTIALAAVCQSRAEAAFSTGWTTVASEGSGGALFYNSHTGLGVTGRFQPDGSFAQFGSYHMTRGWTDIVGAGQTPGQLNATYNYLLFYNRTTGAGATGIDMNGTFGTCHQYQLSPPRSAFWDPRDPSAGWTSVIGYPNGLVVFYNSSTGETKTGVIQACSFTWTQDFHLSPGWTSLAATGDSRVLFYRSDDGEAATGTFSPDGVYNGQQGDTISSGWTNIVGNSEGDLLFYNGSSHIGGTLHQDEDGHLLSPRSYSFSAWTSITGFQNDVVFFYNSATGEAATGTLDSSGFTQTG